MENKVIKNEKYVKVSESTLLSLVSLKLKARILFPEKLETAKKFINNTSSKYFTFINVKTPTGKKGLELIYSLFLILLSFLYSIFLIKNETQQSFRLILNLQ